MSDWKIDIDSVLRDSKFYPEKMLFPGSITRLSVRVIIQEAGRRWDLGSGGCPSFRRAKVRKLTRLFVFSIESWVRAFQTQKPQGRESTQLLRLPTQNTRPCNWNVWNFSLTSLETRRPRSSDNSTMSSFYTVVIIIMKTCLWNAKFWNQAMDNTENQEGAYRMRCSIDHL
jgi:hypothetical protein